MLNSTVSLKACTVVIHDLNQTSHSLEVTAETLYEAIAQALAVIPANDWVGEIGRGLTTVTVKVRHPEVTHTVKIQIGLRPSAKRSPRPSPSSPPTTG